MEYLSRNIYVWLRALEVLGGKTLKVEVVKSSRW